MNLDGMTPGDWIQAVASVIVAIATGVLAWFTSRYVGLTRDLAKVAGLQWDAKVARRNAMKAELLATSSMLLEEASRLPGQQGEDLDAGSLPSDEDLARMQELASDLPGGHEIHTAVSEVTRLTRICRSKVKFIKARRGSPTPEHRANLNELVAGLATIKEFSAEAQG